MTADNSKENQHNALKICQPGEGPIETGTLYRKRATTPGTIFKGHTRKGEGQVRTFLPSSAYITREASGKKKENSGEKNHPVPDNTVQRR